MTNISGDLENSLQKYLQGAGDAEEVLRQVTSDPTSTEKKTSAVIERLKKAQEEGQDAGKVAQLNLLMRVTERGSDAGVKDAYTILANIAEGGDAYALDSGDAGNLLTYFAKQALVRLQKEAEPLLEGLSGESIHYILRALGSVPRDSRADIVQHTVSLLGGRGKITDPQLIADLLVGIARIAPAPEKRAQVIMEKVVPYLEGVTDSGERVAILHLVLMTPENQIADLWTQIQSFLTRVTNSNHRRIVLDEIVHFSPAANRAEVIRLAAPFLANITNIYEMLVFLRAVDEENEWGDRAEVIDRARPVLTGLTGGENISVLLLQVVHMSQREVAATLPQTLLDEFTAVSDRLELLRGVDPEMLRVLRIVGEIGVTSQPYRMEVARDDLSVRPLEVLHNLTALFHEKSREKRSSPELKIEFIGERAVDVGGPSREFVSGLFSGVREQMKFKEMANGLFRPTLSSDEDKKSLQELGELMMLCLNAGQNYPIGMVFDQGVFEALARLQPHHLEKKFEEIGSKGCKELALIFAQMHKYDETQKDTVRYMEESAKFLPLPENISDKDLQDAFRIVELEDGMETLRGEEIKGLRDHRVKIETALRQQLMEFVWPHFAPIIEIAKGMKNARFQNTMSWEKVQQTTPEALSVLLQGEVSRQQIIRQLDHKAMPAAMQVWFENWINNADDVKIKQFLTAMTGAPALGKKPLVIIPGNAVYSHTCFCKLEFPSATLDEKGHVVPFSEELFVKTLEKDALKLKTYTRA